MKALLVGIQLPKVSNEENEASLRELARLVNTLGHEVVGQMSQKRNSTGGATVVGEGKLRELANWTGGPGKVIPTFEAKKSKAALRFATPFEESSNEGNDVEDEVDDREAGPEDEVESLEAAEDEIDGEDHDSSVDQAPNEKPDLIVFDCDLTPSQLRNLESATGTKVLDRTGVIIEIFSRHARTRAARLQVEIARLKYMAPRIRETGGGGDRQGGGIGAKGAGETSYELDRRRIRDRIKELRHELEGVQNEHAVRRTRRSTENTVALVGYTNAGKSSLMRAMTGSEIYVADKLFATLDTTVRPVHPETVPRILLSDTVGFIKKLPHDLVASFRSTLDEALNADLLLYVVDASDPTFRSQLAVTQKVLAEIGANEISSWLVLNKRDQLNEAQMAELHREFPQAVFLSTRNADDLKELRNRLVEFFERDMIEESVFVPYNVQGAIGEIRSQMRVVSENFDEHGAHLRVRSRPELLSRLRQKFSLRSSP